MFKGIPRVLIVWCLATQVQFHWITTDRLGSGLSSGRTSSRLIQLEADPQVIHVLKSDSEVATAHFSLPWNFAPLHSSLKKMKDCEGTHTVCWHPLSVQAPSGMHWVDYTHLSWPCMNSASRYRHQKTKGVWSKKTAIASQRKQHKCFLYSRARTSATAAERYDLAVIRNQHQQMPNPVSACPQGGSNDPLATFSRGLLHVRSGPSAPPYRANGNMTCWGSFSWTHHGWIILDRKEAKDG